MQFEYKKYKNNNEYKYALLTTELTHKMTYIHYDQHYYDDDDDDETFCINSIELIDMDFYAAQNIKERNTMMH